ncbi:phage portal protein [Agrococcus casei]|uniref:Phage portal protein n=1 Tax=Agrococcus casei LMG 22410 TaxID=1255656 RepID=A0A1R4GFE3_9MICO|nr:phage portal protein [Agrococcus casei]SJM66853.1 Phage portal protein [Agrococcus casei LMG 22410]
MGLREWLTGQPSLAVPTAAKRAESLEPGPNKPHLAAARVQPPPREKTDRSVSMGKALSLSMVYRAVSIHIISAKQLGIDVSRTDAETGEETTIPTPTIIRRPNPFASRSQFIEQTVGSLAGNGNAYWRLQRDDAGNLRNVEVLNPLDIVIRADRNGHVDRYDYRGRTYKPSEIEHLTLLRVPGSAYGLGPIQAAQSELAGALDLRDHAHNFFLGPGGQPTGILKTDSALTTETANSIKERWDQTQGGTRGIAVLGHGVTYSPVFVSPRDAQFIESQEFTTTQIARLFGVPASLMLAAVEGNSQTYSNVEQDWIGYVRFSLMQYLIEIEDALTNLLPRGQRVRFNIDALLRSDTKTRYEAHEIAIRAGFLTVPEVRDLEKYPPLRPQPVNESAA